jgi:hypothetical protein
LSFLPYIRFTLSLSSTPFPFLFHSFLSRPFHIFFPFTLVPGTFSVRLLSQNLKTFLSLNKGYTTNTYDKGHSDTKILILGNKQS